LNPADTQSTTWRGQLDRRTSICLYVIAIGLANFLFYTIAYLIIGGEAIHGKIISIGGQTQYLLGGRDDPVSRLVFIYSAIHSISIWPTFGAVMLAMLTIAKDRIVESMRSALVRGRAIITLIAVIITIVAILLTFTFTRQFVRLMKHEPQVQEIQQADNE
jgi:hypothetical protein